MTALPINPTPEELMQAWRDMPSMTNLADVFRSFHQAGVEAERARAAAETTEHRRTYGPEERFDQFRDQPCRCPRGVDHPASDAYPAAEVQS